MAQLTKILEFLQEELSPASFEDASFNGLQIEGAAEVQHVAVAVDAGETIIEKAIAAHADLLIVHHGILWGRALPCTGPLKRLLKKAFAAELSLYASHLPLDAHQKYGNNFGLARELELKNLLPAFLYNGSLIGCCAENTQKRTREDFMAELAKLPGASESLLSLPFGPEIPQKVGIVTGSGGDFLEQCVTGGIDTFISGEPKQSVYHFAKENSLNALFGGHYATETIGIQELAKGLAKKFDITWTFIDCPTGI